MLSGDTEEKQLNKYSNQSISSAEDILGDESREGVQVSQTLNCLLPFFPSFFFPRFHNKLFTSIYYNNILRIRGLKNINL